MSPQGIRSMCMSAQEQTWSYERPMRLASRGRIFKATVYAMYTGLVPKGIYKQGEFQKFFVEWTRKRTIEEGPRAALAAPGRNSRRIGSLCA
jgi:hypothetical protein